MDEDEAQADGDAQAQPPVDQRGRLREQPFGYRVSKDQDVLVSWRGKQVMRLKGAQAQKLLKRLEGLDAHALQLALAKLTGNFKRGNER